MLIALLALADSAGAGTFRVSPTLGNVAPGRSIATFRVHNPASALLTVQISAMDWAQRDGADVMDASDRVLVVPPLVTIPPGSTQIVRVALKGPRPAHELPFRLHIEEVPPPPPPGFLGLQTVVKVDLPLFFAPQHIDGGALEWAAERSTDGEVMLVARNDRNRYLRASRIRVYDGADTLVGDFGGPLYVLAGTQRSWPLADGALREGQRLRVVLDDERKRREHSVVIR